MEKPKTPQLDKMLEVQTESQKIGEFLDWLNEKKIYLCKPVGYFTEINKTTEELLADYFDINLEDAEQERKALLECERWNSGQQ